VKATVRPTTSKVAEAIFQIVAHRLGTLQGMRVLDVFAGTGQLGLWALERGAREAVFVEQDRAVAAKLRAAGRPGVQVMQGSARNVLQRVSGPFDLVFMDPPYSTDLALQSLSLIDERALLAPAGLVVVEHHHKDAVPQKIGGLRRERLQRYGETAVSFYVVGEVGES
jgi:16S rRNA (guanine(966)-N(2))-methyltransferase RsmD